MTLGVPVVYDSLELEAEQVLCRIAAYRLNIPWSRIWLGRFSDDEKTRIEFELSQLCDKALQVNEGRAGAYSKDDMRKSVECARRSRPNGNIFVVLDFLQLAGGDQRELREKIGGMAAEAKQLARQYRIAILLLSSVGRDKYSLLNSAVDAAGIGTLKTQYGGIVRTIANPDVLVGLGKESGDIEYCCDSVTVIVRWPHQPDGPRLLVLAVPKKRYGAPSWSMLRVENGCRLEEHNADALDALPVVEQKRGGKVAVSEDVYVQRVIESVHKMPGKLKSNRDIVQVTVGNCQAIRDAVKQLKQKQLIRVADDGFLWPVEPTGATEPISDPQGVLPL